MSEVVQESSRATTPVFETPEEFMAEAMEWFRGTYILLALDVGLRAGLEQTFRDVGEGTAAEIAAAGGCSERHVREWLSVMATCGVARYEPSTGVFRAAPGFLATPLPPEPTPIADYARLLPDVADTIRNGGGIPYAAYQPDFMGMLARMGAASADRFLLSEWVPSAPGLAERLTAGVAVLEVGCGIGHALNVLGRAFPASTFMGYDLDAGSIDTARTEAASWGLDNVHFEVRDVADLPDDAVCDVALAFDTIHDQARPRQVLAEIRRALVPDGLFVMLEPKLSSELADNIGDPRATFLYTGSLFHCMQVSLAEGGEGLGSAWGRQRALELLDEAGFDVVDVVDAPMMLTTQSLFVSRPR